MKEAFGMEGGTKAQITLNRQEQVDKMVEEEKSPMPRLDERIMQGTDDLRQVNTPIPETPEMKRGIFSRSEGTPYFACLHMVTPKRTLRVTETPQPRYQVEAEVVTGGEYYEGSEDDYDNVQELDEG